MYEVIKYIMQKNNEKNNQCIDTNDNIYFRISKYGIRSNRAKICRLGKGGVL